MKSLITPRVLAIAALAIAAGSAPLAAQPTPPIAGNWTLTFQDEFSGSALNSDLWRFGQHYAGNGGEAGANTPGNITLSGGTLRLRTGYEPGYFGHEGNTNYTMSEISTYKPFPFKSNSGFRQKYGYFEARIKHTGQAGLWPAFWLMPDRANYGAAETHRRSYLKFNLSSAGISTVNSAILRMTVDDIEDGGGQNILAMKVHDDSWTETGTSGITWNNAPTPDPLWIVNKYNFDQATGTTMDFDVKGYVTEEINGNKIISICLADTFHRTRMVRFYTREHTNQNYRPKLIVNGTTYYPVADATIRAGSYANDNTGTGPYLTVEDAYGSPDNNRTEDGGMEIDIMESLGVWGAHSTGHTLHWDGYPSTNTGSGQLNYAATSDSFHTYGLYWEEGLVEFYIDGNPVPTWSWANSRVMSVPAYIILSHQLGGWGTNNDVNPNVHNKFMEIDYVRVWSGEKAAPGTQTPYVTVNLPGTVQAENFDSGGEDVAYNDTTAGNAGNASYRPGENVDISTSTDPGGNGYHVNFPTSGEWLEYTVTVDFTGLYDFEFRVASNYTGKNFRMEVDGVSVSGNITVPNTGGWQNWDDVTKTGVSLTAGQHVIRIHYNTDGFNFNRFTANYAAVSLPATIEAEDFDEGGEGVTYHDTTSGNNGGEYRSTDVDIAVCGDTGDGYNIGWPDTGEWLEYTVYVPTATTYDIDFRVASDNTSGGTFHLKVDGVNVTNTMTAPDTGGWQTYQTITKTGVTLQAGVHVIRVHFQSNGFNLNWIRFRTN